MSRTLSESHSAHHALPADGATSAADFSGELISDDDIPWAEIFADDDSGIEGVSFDPGDYASDAEMMAAAEALLLKWSEEGADED